MKKSRLHGKKFSFSAILFCLATAVSLSACNPQGDISTIEAGFHPGLVSAQRNSFSSVWDFNTNASYAYDSSKIQFTGGVCSLKGTDQVDDDNSASGFGGGSLSGVAWDAGNSYVRLSAGTNTAELDSSWTPKYSSIQAYWKLNESSFGSGPGGSDFINNIGNGFNLSRSGTVGLVASGHIQRSASFDGASANATFPASPLSGTGSFAVAGWFKTNLTGRMQIITIGSQGVGNRAISIYVNTSSGISMDLSGASGPLSSTPLNDGIWHQFFIVNTANSVQLYIDGSAVGSSISMSPDIDNTQPTTIGSSNASFGSPYYFNGQLDDLAVWNTFLTAEEVQNIYSRQSARYSGTFTSRVMDAVQTGMNWTTLSWKPTLPFLKNLPDYASGGIQNESSTDYASLVGSTGSVGDNNLMSGIVGLWHLAGGAGNMISDSATILESSGKGLTCVAKNADGLGMAYQKSILGSGIAFDGTDDYIDCGTTSFGITSAFTVSAWAYTTADNDGRIISKHGTTAHFGWLLSRASFASSAIEFAFSNDGSTWHSALSSANAFPLNQWVHIVARYDGAQSRLWVNGVENTTNGFPLTYSGVVNDSSQRIEIGKDDGNNSLFTGSIDEVAIWNRALDPKEILQLYRRGANRVKHQVRVCTAADCSDDASGANWKGPDGTNQTYFSELNNNTVALAMTGAVKATPPSMLFSAFTNPVGTSRYFQYRTILESDDTGTGCNYGSGATWCSPELKSVTVDPVHYDSSSPTVVGHTGVSFYSLASFTQTLGSLCAGGIGYNLGVGRSYSSAVWYWWDSSANSGAGGWSASDGTVTKSNDAATINSHASTFGTQVSMGTVYFKAFLKSSGSTACELDQLDLGGQQ